MTENANWMLTPLSLIENRLMGFLSYCTNCSSC